jgi:DNA polymerase III alpha subunit
MSLLRVRTGYSFRQATGHLEEVIARLKAIGATHAPITDRASTFAFNRWTKLAIKAGLHPVFGVELSVTPSLNAKKPVTDNWLFIARESITPINRLMQLATTQFRYQPLLTMEQALAAASEVAVIAGHRALLEGVEPVPGAYLALSPATSKGQLALASRWPLAATGDNRFTQPTDKAFYEVLVGRNAETQTYPQHILSPEEWRAAVAKLGLVQEVLAEAEQASATILEGCTAALQRAELPHPHDNPGEFLKKQCQARAKALKMDLKKGPYAERYAKEWALIETKKYEDYFFIVADLVTWARQRMIVGPARGSSCGSLVCYLLGITAIDPLPFGLIFERFVDINRADMPDIDIDFSDQQRHLVFEYLNQKYGAAHVARLGVVTMFKPRSALVEVASALRLPKWKCEAVADSIIERSSGDSRALNSLEDTLATMPAGQQLLADHPEAQIVCRFEGHPRHYCLAGSTAIKLGQGSKATIAELYRQYVTHPTEDVVRRKSKPLLVSMEPDERCRPQKAAKIWFAGYKSCVRLVFSNGTHVDCTGNHKFFINGAWKRCRYAQVGDRFQCLKKPAKGGKKGWSVGNQDHWTKKKDWSNHPGGSFKKGEQHPSFKHGIGRLIAAQRSEYAGKKCQSCKQQQGADIHHNDGKHGSDNPHDVMWVCKSCHRKIHRLDGRRWQQGLETTTTKLVKVIELPVQETYDIEMPEHHNFVLANGIIASNSQHAAGVVIAKGNILDYVAVDHRTNATMCDKKDAEEGYNLLKIDALGLTQLSVFEDALALAGLPPDTLDHVPLDDPAAFEVLNKAQFSGIFQFNGMALQSIAKQFRCTTFNDIVSITALARPGALASGGAHEWVRRKNGVHAVTYPHELLRPYLADTLGIVLYQEQVMEIGRNVGDLTWGQVSELRKAMSKSLGKEYFDKFGDPWKKAAIAKGFAPKDADKVWDDLCAYGAMGFNKSHSVAYGLISYWCCWLKAHHAFEFAAATLTHERDVTKQIKILREMMVEGYDYVPIDPDRSTDKWSVGSRHGKKVLVGPLQNVAGIGPKILADILNCRKLGKAPPARARKLLTDAKTPLDSLWPIRDAFHAIMPDPLERNIVTPPTRIIELVPEAEDRSVMLFCTLTKINPRDENEVIMVARRGGKKITDGKTTSLNLQLMDDTDTIFGKVSRFTYPTMGKEVVDRGRTDKALYAIKGKLKGHRGNPSNSFRMVMIEGLRYIGDLDDLKPKKEPKSAKKKRVKTEAAQGDGAA